MIQGSSPSRTTLLPEREKEVVKSRSNTKTHILAPHSPVEAVLLLQYIAGFMPYFMVLPSFVRFFLLFSQLLSLSHALVACTSSTQCENILRQGSECVKGFCTNPFFYQGCLRTFFPDWDKTRVCSSDDPPEAAEKGYCKTSPWNYMEMRVLAQNWETSFFETWILQIVLSKSR